MDKAWGRGLDTHVPPSPRHLQTPENKLVTKRIILYESWTPALWWGAHKGERQMGLRRWGQGSP